LKYKEEQKMNNTVYVKYKCDPWDHWAVIGSGDPGLDWDANNAGVVFIACPSREAQYVRWVAGRMLAAMWEPNQSHDEREQNRHVIEECIEILNHYRRL
jgi:hypothetical protein